MRKKIEILYPYIIGLSALTIFLVYIYCFENSTPKTIGDAISQSVSLGGIFAGFLYTAKSLLFALPDRPVVERVRDMDKMEELVSYISTSVYHWLFVSIFSLSYIIVKSVLPDNVRFLIICIWTAAIFTAIGSFLRSVNLVSYLLKMAS